MDSLLDILADISMTDEQLFEGITDNQLVTPGNT